MHYGWLDNICSYLVQCLIFSKVETELERLLSFNHLIFLVPSSIHLKFPSQKMCSYFSHLHSTVSLIHWPRTSVDHGSSGLVEVETELGVTLVHVVGKGVAA